MTHFRKIWYFENFLTNVFCRGSRARQRLAGRCLSLALLPRSLSHVVTLFKNFFKFKNWGPQANSKQAKRRLLRSLTRILLLAHSCCRGDTRLSQLKAERFVRTVHGYNLVNMHGHSDWGLRKIFDLWYRIRNRIFLIS